MAERGFRVTGVDSSPTFISLCRERIPGHEFLIEDVRERSGCTVNSTACSRGTASFIPRRTTSAGSRLLVQRPPVYDLLPKMRDLLKQNMEAHMRSLDPRAGGPVVGASRKRLFKRGKGAIDPLRTCRRLGTGYKVAATMVGFGS
jgi:hypothetical protein